MRALIATGDGSVELAEAPEPVRRSSELLVQVSASALHNADLYCARTRPPGTVVGVDTVGVVLEAAEDGSGPAAGTRIMGYTAMLAGSWAERVAIDSSLVAVIPDTLPDEVAAALPNCGLAALGGLEAAGFLLGARVLVTGANGGVGTLALQLAYLAGAQVTAAVRSSRGAEQLSRFDWLTTIAIDEAEGPFDLVIELVGGEVLGRAMTLVAENGVVASLAQTVRQEASIPVFWFAAHPGARLVGVANSARFEREAGRGPRRLDLLARLAGAGRLVPNVTTTASWEQAPALLAALKRRELTGKAVILIGG